MDVNQLLRPEELDDEELVRILTSLDVPVSFHNPRSHLLDVYKRVALPLPQRQKSCTNGNPELTNSSVTKSSCECNLLKLVKRELVPITHIVDNTKKVKLIDKLHRGSSPEAMDECSDEYSSQVDGYIDSKQERSKRKLCADFADHIKRIKITP